MASSGVTSIRDRFTIVRELGGGGMGVVYEAVDRHSGRHMALKTIRVPSGDALLRFKQEFRSLQDLHHPNLVTLGELIEENGQWWFSMELVRGTNLRTHVQLAPPVSSPPPDAPNFTDALAPTLPPGSPLPTENPAEASAPAA